MTNSLLNVVADHIEDGYVLVDDERVVGCNRAARELLGIDADSTTTPVASLPPPVREILDGHDDGDSWRTHEVEVGTGDRSRHLEVDLASVDDGRLPGDLLLVRDVTERVRRNRDRSVLEATGDAVYTLDADGICTYSNRAHDELFGYDEGEMVGLSVSAVLDESTIERLEDEVRSLLRGDGPPRTVIEHEVITNDGERIPVENHVSLLLDDEGEFYGTAGVVRDVRERKEREEQLQRYERIVEAMGDGVYSLDADGELVEFNEYMVDLTGYDRETLRGADPTLWHDDEDLAAFETAIRGLLAGEGDDVKTIECTIIRADESEVPIEVNLTLLPRAAGEFRGTVGVVRDVTERRERQQELERYETLLDVMPDTVVVTDTEGVIENIHGFEGWSGYAKEELVGQHLSKTNTPEGIERAEELIGELIADDELEKVTYEMDVVTRDGEHVPHENHLSLLPPDEDGMIPGSISVLRDVSERKAHERALEALNATTRELVAAESKEAVVEMAVRTATGVLDLPLTGAWLYDDDEEALVPVAYPEAQELPEDPPTFRPGESLAWAVFESGQPRLYDGLGDVEDVHNPETAIKSEVIAPLGDHGILLAGTTEPGAFGEDQRNLAGILGAAVGTALDRLEREGEREAQRHELRRKNEQLEQFASVLSHDLRNPLNVAHARVKNAIQKGDTEKLESADDALVRMNELIGDLLTLAREGRIVGETEAVSLAGAADEAWRSVEAPEASLAVGDDVAVEADRARLCELLENLFRNSVDHAGSDVKVLVDSLPSGGFYVEDDGPGIPEDERDHVFEQGVTSTADGTGFGLTIVASIAEAHGWSVSLVEGSEGGARFEFARGSQTGVGGGSSG